MMLLIPYMELSVPCCEGSRLLLDGADISWQILTNGIFAYKIKGDTIMIMDACHVQNMYEK